MRNLIEYDVLKTPVAGENNGYFETPVLQQQQRRRSIRCNTPSRFKCSYCLKEFNFESNLKCHEHIHKLNRHRRRDSIVSSKKEKKKKSKKEKSKKVSPKTTTTSKKVMEKKDVEPKSSRYKTRGANKKVVKETEVTIEAKTLFECDKCDKKYARKGNLDKHKATHSQPNPLKCKVCKAVLEFAEDVSEHEQIHKWLNVVDKCFPFNCNEEDLVYKNVGNDSDDGEDVQESDDEKPTQCESNGSNVQESSLHVEKDEELTSDNDDVDDNLTSENTKGLDNLTNELHEINLKSPEKSPKISSPKKKLLKLKLFRIAGSDNWSIQNSTEQDKNGKDNYCTGSAQSSKTSEEPLPIIIEDKISHNSDKTSKQNTNQTTCNVETFTTKTTKTSQTKTIESFLYTDSIQTQISLKYHQSIELNDNPLKCDEWDDEFNEKEYLEFHQLNHNNDTPLSFTVTKHIITHTRQTGTNIYL